MDTIVADFLEKPQSFEGPAAILQKGALFLLVLPPGRVTGRRVLVDVHFHSQSQSQSQRVVASEVAWQSPESGC